MRLIWNSSEKFCTVLQWIKLRYRLLHRALGVSDFFKVYVIIFTEMVMVTLVLPGAFVRPITVKNILMTQIRTIIDKGAVRGMDSISLLLECGSDVASILRNEITRVELNNWDINRSNVHVLLAFIRLYPDIQECRSGWVEVSKQSLGMISEFRKVENFKVRI